MRTLSVVFAGLTVIAAGCAYEPDGIADRDNTAINERDVRLNTTTPLDQSNDQSDIDLVAKIRSEVLDIDNLSVNGRNVKIITNDGKVTLRGPVQSETERNAIVEVAESIAGPEQVDNQLEIETR